MTADQPIAGDDLADERQVRWVMLHTAVVILDELCEQRKHHTVQAMLWFPQHEWS